MAHLEDEFRPYGKTFFGFYIGAQDPYNGFVDDNKALDEELTEAGIPHVFEIYQGAHDGAFWREHQDEWLARRWSVSTRRSAQLLTARLRPGSARSARRAWRQAR